MPETKVSLPSAPNREWFKERLAAAGYSSVAHFCTKLGYPDAPALSRTLNGLRRLKIAEARRIAVLLRVPLAQLLEHSGTGGHRDLVAPAVPLVGLVDGRGKVSANWEATKGDHVGGPGRLPDGSVALAIEDGIHQGALIFVGPVGSVAEHGGLAVVGLADGSEFACLLRRGARSMTILGWPGIGEPRKTNAALAWARPVLWMQMA